MARLILTEKLMPSEEVQKNFSFKVRNQLKFMVVGNIILFCTIFLFSIIEFILGNFLVGAVTMISTLMSVTSIVSMRKGNIKVAAVISTTALLAADALVCLFATSSYSESSIIYRNVYFVATMAVMNVMMAVDIKQILVYDIASFVIFQASNIFVTENIREADMRGFIVAVMISSLAYLMIMIALRNMVKHNDKLIAAAKADNDRAEDNIRKIKNIVSESEEGLKIGDSLKEVANDASSKSAVISEAFNTILPKIDTLSENLNILESNIRIIQEGAGKMQVTSENQARNVETTSSAMVQISANVTTISDTAQKRKSQLNEMAESVGHQKDLANSLGHQLQKVEEYSQVINGFVRTINKISEQTNLLAMNASIEAAHAGKMGEGFSVIAQEIRKLSTETSNNAKNIEVVLKENTDVVNETVQTMAQFNTYVESSGKSATETLNSIDEIISGIMEIDVGNKEISKSISEMVNGAKETTYIIDNVSTEIERQIDPVKNVVAFMNGLREEVNHLNGEIISIQNTLSQISNDAEVNAVVGKTILTSLNEI